MNGTRVGKVVSFDLDGTLINGPFTKVLTDLDNELSATTSAGGAKREILRRHQHLLSSDVLAAYDWQSIVARYVDELQAPPPFDLLDRLDVHAIDGTTIIHDHTFEHLDQLRSHGWRLVVLTNGWRRYQEPVLRRCGLLDAIDALVTSDDVGEPKPAAAMFAAARGTADRLVHVGDRIDHDVIGGNRAGAETALLRSDVPMLGPGSEHAAEIAPYLAELAARQGMASPLPTDSSVPDLLATDLAQVVAWLGN